MRAAAAEGLEKSAGEAFRYEARALRPGKVGVAHQGGVSSQRAASAALRDACPTSEQWPHGTLVIADGVEDGGCVVDRAHAPIGGEVMRGPLRKHGARLGERFFFRP